jgi:phage major head subunit gpT-like protein
MQCCFSEALQRQQRVNKTDLLSSHQQSDGFRCAAALSSKIEKSSQASVSCQESASTAAWAGGWPQFAKTWGDRFLVELM